ncbi:MAG TPA: hypothetical protein VFM95_09450, partial [Microcella sp.]|nr:hypothetical protein [Microcella sp.]
TGHASRELLAEIAVTEYGQRMRESAWQPIDAPPSLQYRLFTNESVTIRQGAPATTRPVAAAYRPERHECHKGVAP